MIEKQVYPDDELIRQWSHKVQPPRCIAFNENQPGPSIEWVRAMLAEAVDWARDQTARECIELCAAPDCADDKIKGVARVIENRISAAFNLKESPND